MGKISKALEKAEKANDINSAPQAKNKHALSKIETIESSLKSTETEDYEDYKARIRKYEHQEMVLPEHPRRSQPIARQYDRTNDFLPSIESTEATEAPLEQNLSPMFKKKTTQIGIQPEIASNGKGTSVEAKSNQEENLNLNSDNLNVALLKQNVIKPGPPSQQFGGNEEIRSKPPYADIEGPRKRVRVHYSRTKVQFNDPNKLINNKIPSVIEDMEITNEFKILRTQVLKKLKQIGGNSILVTSANPFEGKTFTSINLGVSIAKEFDRTVLIIDADIRKPLYKHTDFSTQFFSLKVDKGLTDYLEGDVGIEDILINPGIDKLTLIPGGLPVDNSAELLNSDRMEEMMTEIKSRYPSDRLIIVDGPSFLHYPDAMILCRYVNGVLPVIESSKTPVNEAKRMMKSLEEVNILGVVMNKNRGY